MDYKKLQEKIDAIWKDEPIAEQLDEIAVLPGILATGARAIAKGVDGGMKPEPVDGPATMQMPEPTPAKPKVNPSQFQNTGKNSPSARYPERYKYKPRGPAGKSPGDAGKSSNMEGDAGSYGQDFFRSVLDQNDVPEADAQEATVSEATQGPGVDAVMELIDMGISKEDLFDQMMRDHSDDELMSFADDYRRTNDLLGDEEGDDSIDIDPDQDDSNVFQQSNY
jgi:hypothetical protein